MTEPSTPGATPYDGYAPGSKDPFGRVIRTVVGRHRHMIVYVTTDHAVGWNYDQLPDRLRPAVAEFQVLNGMANACLPNKLRGLMAVLLAGSLYSALLCPEGKDPKAEFGTVQAFIRKKASERGRLNYVLLSFVSALSIAGLARLPFLVTGIPPVVPLGIAGGVMGACISIIQRGWRLRVDPGDSVFYLAWQGFVRVVLGAIFGAFLVVAVRANLFLGKIADDPWTLFGFCVAAGFSERFVPDLLERSLERTERPEEAKPA